MAWIRSNKKAVAPTTYESYIYNVGYCAFNSGYIHSANTKIKFKAELESWKSGGDWQVVFGSCKDTYRSNAFIFWSRADGTKLGYSRTNYYIQGDEVTASESSTSANWTFVPCIFTAEGQAIYWYKEDDPATIRSLSAPGTVDSGFVPIAIFNVNTATTAGGWRTGNGSTGFMKLYWFEIYEDDVLLHRFVPAYHNNQYCLYDEIGNTYIYDTINSGANLRGFIAT